VRAAARGLSRSELVRRLLAEADGAPATVPASRSEALQLLAEKARSGSVDREMHLEPDAGSVAVGDTFEVVRGNGPREGDHMGTATVTGFEDGSPVLDVRFDGRSVDV
jgi:hypothetical protein